MAAGQGPGSVLVIGEALVDVVDGSEHPGGSPANVALALGRLGVPVVLATQLGDDPYGVLIRDHLAASHVGLIVDEAERTSSAKATIGSTGAASYTFDITWQPRFERLPEATVLHVGSFTAAATPPPEHPFISYDINVRPTLMPPDARATVEALVARTRILKASDEDLDWLSPGVPWEETARRLLDLGPRIVWITRGSGGAVGLTRDRRYVVAARNVEVVDTIGAGDTFSAGLIAGWLRFGDDWQRVGDAAAALAGHTVGRVGADPPWEWPFS